MMLPLVFALAQDLWERAAPPVEKRVSTDRLDLRIGPLVSRETTIHPGELSLNLDLSPDLACGQFDLAASFKSILDKNMRDKLVGALLEHARSELAGSAMVLACQMSPTVCDAMKHYRVTAQDFLQMQLSQCSSIEQLAEGPNQQMRAAAIKACLERKQAEGLTLDEAMKQCRTANQVQGLRGQSVQEINLVREVGDALGLSDKARTLLSTFVNDVAIGPHRYEGAVKVRATDARYEDERSKVTAALTEAVEVAKQGLVPPELLKRLSPAGMPPITNEEIQRLARMDEVDRSLVIGMLASSMALAQVVREAGDVRAALASASAMTLQPAVQQALEREAARIESEVARLREAFEIDTLVTQARLRADAAVAAATAERLHRSTASWHQRDREAAANRSTQPWSNACPTQKK